MSYVTLRAAIKSKMDTLVPVTLKAVYNGEQSKQGKEVRFPSAEIVRIQTQPDYFTNRQDMQVYSFLLNIYQVAEETNDGDVEVSLDSVIDSIMQMFLSDPQLGAVVTGGRVFPVENQTVVTTWLGRMCRREQIMLQIPMIKNMD